MAELASKDQVLASKDKLLTQQRAQFILERDSLLQRCHVTNTKLEAAEQMVASLESGIDLLNNKASNQSVNARGQLQRAEQQVAFLQEKLLGAQRAQTAACD